MNPERADSSYTAWDKAIVAQSRRPDSPAPATAQQAAAQSPTTQSASQTEGSGRAFRAALAANDDHERAYDATWRTTAAATGSGPTARDPENEDFGFWDFIDVINPLQHIPLVSTLYRELTGDEISAPARIMGGALYGGPLGFAASIGNAIVEEATGKDAGEIALAMVLEDDAPGNDSEPDGTTIATASAVNPNSGQDVDTNAALTAGPAVAAVAAAASETLQSRETAGHAAVSQMVAGNAALQDLLREMGIAQGTGATAKPASNSAFADSSPTKTSPRNAHQADVYKPAVPNPGGFASLPAVPGTDTQGTATPATATQRGTVQTQVADQADHRATSTEPRRGIPIDTSRYVNTKAAANAPRTVALTETSGTAAGAQVLAGASAAKEAVTASGPMADKTALQASFADRMLEALDRYQAMNKQSSSLPEVNAADQIDQRAGAI